MKTLRLRQGFFVLFFAAWALLGAEAHGAVVDPIHPYPSDYHYQLRDVSEVQGKLSQDGFKVEGAQWFATSFENWFWSTINSDDTHIRYLRTRGAGTERAMVTSADLVYRKNHVCIDEWQPYPVGPLYDDYMDPIDSLYLVIPEGHGDWTIRFANDRAHHFPWTNPAYLASGDAMQDVRITDLDENYSITTSFDRAQLVAPEESLEQRFRFSASYSEEYGSVLGHVTFRQSASHDVAFGDFRERIDIPLVVANVYNGPASEPGHELYFDMTLTEISSDVNGLIASGDVVGDVVTRTKFRWGAGENRIQPLGTFFFPMFSDSGRLPIYTLTSRITNRTGVRYRIQRYDTLAATESDDVIGGRSPNDLKPLHWRYDLPSDLYGSLPSRFLLDAQSQIAPGLVTVYENKIDMSYDFKESFRLAHFSASNMRNLTLTYDKIRGLRRLDRKYSSSTDYRWRATAFRFTKFVDDDEEDAENTQDELTDKMGKPPVFPGAVSTVISDRDDLGKNISIAFSINTAVPEGLVSMEQKSTTNASGDIVTEEVSADIAVLPVQLRIRIPRKTQPLNETLWRELEDPGNDSPLDSFLKYGTIGVRSTVPNSRNTDLFSAIRNRGTTPSECVNAFIHDDALYLDFNVLLADGKSPLEGYSAYCYIVRDDGVPYILLGDGAEDGRWNLSFFVAEAGSIPLPSTPPSDNDNDNNTPDKEGGGGCNASFPLLALAGAGLLVRGYRRGR